MPALHDTMRRLLAAPREAGTPGADAARDLVAAHLEALGYRVERQRVRLRALGSRSAFPCSARASARWRCCCFPR